jgi:hypothetical protein
MQLRSELIFSDKTPMDKKSISARHESGVLSILSHHRLARVPQKNTEIFSIALQDFIENKRAFGRHFFRAMNSIPNDMTKRYNSNPYFLFRTIN